MAFNFQRLLNDIQTDADNNRMDVQEKRMDIYLDDYLDQVIACLKLQFTPENYEVLRPMIARHNNFFKRIVNVKSVIYNDEPVRKWFKSAGEIETDEKTGEAIDEIIPEPDEQYDELITKSNIAQSAITIDKLTNVNNVAFMRAVVRDGKMEYDAVAPENIIIEQDDDDLMKYNALWHRISKTNTRDEHVVMWHVWTNGKSNMDTESTLVDFPNGFFQKMNFNGEPVEAMIPNPYIDPDTNIGVIPYIDWRISTGTDFWMETVNEDLRWATLQVNVDETHINNLIKFGGYRQLVITGNTDDDQLNHAKSDVMTFIKVKAIAGQTVPTVTALDQTKDPKELQDAINRIMGTTAANHGISFNADALGAQKQTAEAMTINRQQLVDLRQERIPTYRESERRLARTSVIIANTSTNNTGLGMSIDFNGQFSIDFQEPVFISDPFKDYELDRMKVLNNMISDVDHIMKLNPDIKTEDEAKKRIKKNKETQTALGVGATSEIEEEIEAVINGGIESGI